MAFSFKSQERRKLLSRRRNRSTSKNERFSALVNDVLIFLVLVFTGTLLMFSFRGGWQSEFLNVIEEDVQGMAHQQAFLHNKQREDELWNEPNSVLLQDHELNWYYGENDPSQEQEHKEETHEWMAPRVVETSSTSRARAGNLLRSTLGHVFRIDHDQVQDEFKAPGIPVSGGPPGGVGAPKGPLPGGAPKGPLPGGAPKGPLPGGAPKGPLPGGAPKGPLPGGVAKGPLPGGVPKGPPPGGLPKGPPGVVAKGPPGGFPKGPPGGVPKGPGGPKGVGGFVGGVVKKVGGTIGAALGVKKAVVKQVGGGVKGRR